jgi:hypothetical protein
MNSLMDERFQIIGMKCNNLLVMQNKKALMGIGSHQQI